MAGDKDTEILTLFRNPHRTPLPDKVAIKLPDSDEDSCAAFGYLRDAYARTHMLECRLNNGNMEAFPYNLLGSVRYNPSVGVLLRFSGELTTLVLIEGSNLDVVPKDLAANLTDRGILKHRITWVREMDEDEVRKAPSGQPFIDRLRIAEFESEDAVRKWFALNAPAFARK